MISQKVEGAWSLVTYYGSPDLNQKLFEAQVLCATQLVNMGLHEALTFQGVRLPLKERNGLPFLEKEKSENRLTTDFLLVSPEKRQPALNSIWKALEIVSAMTRNVGGPHLSLEHGISDMADHGVAVSSHIDDPLIQEQVDIQVIEGHRIDDFADRINPAGAAQIEFGEFHRGDSLDEMVYDALFKLDPSGDLIRINREIKALIKRDLPFFDDEHRALLNFSTRRLLRNWLIFSGPAPKRAHHLRDDLREVLEFLPRDSSLKSYLRAQSLKDRAFAKLWAASSKPNIEAMTSVSDPNISREAVQFGNIMLGPLVASHDEAQEGVKGMSVNDMAIIHHLERVGDMIKKCPGEERKKIVAIIPEALEQSRATAPQALIEFYVNFLTDDRIIHSLPINPWQARHAFTQLGWDQFIWNSGDRLRVFQGSRPSQISSSSLSN